MKVFKVVAVMALLLLTAIAAFVAWVYYLSWYVGTWDKKIDALCAANGGANVATRVYETAFAPETKEYFADIKPNRSLFVPTRSRHATLGPEYPYVMESHVVEVLKDAEPIVVKYTVRVVRASDNKVLAEKFGFRRSGGGFVVLDGTDGHVCPKERLEDRLEARVFTNDPQHHMFSEKR